MEIKQKILDRLLPALQTTESLHDLWDLQYNCLSRTVTAVFADGSKQTVEVAGSGAGMIVDVVQNLTFERGK